MRESDVVSDLNHLREGGQGREVLSEKEAFKWKPQGWAGFNQEEYSREKFQAEETSAPSSSAQRLKFHQQNQPSGERIVVLCF